MWCPAHCYIRIILDIYAPLGKRTACFMHLKAGWSFRGMCSKYSQRITRALHNAQISEFIGLTKRNSVQWSNSKPISRNQSDVKLVPNQQKNINICHFSSDWHRMPVNSMLCFQKSRSILQQYFFTITIFLCWHKLQTASGQISNKCQHEPNTGTWNVKRTKSYSMNMMCLWLMVIGWFENRFSLTVE